MKKIINLIIVLGIMIGPAIAFADTVDKHNISVEEVLKEIRLSKNVTDNKDLQCEKISNKEFEKLGEAVMSLRHPDEKEHELVDRMMGGEGSKSLEQMHIQMGASYIDCGGGMMGDMMSRTSSALNVDTQSRGMMSSGINNKAGYNYNKSSSMMGDFDHDGIIWIFMFIFGIFIVVVVFFFLKALSSQNRTKISGSSDSAIDILKQRYAKGEISKKEFEDKKRDLV